MSRITTHIFLSAVLAFIGCCSAQYLQAVETVARDMAAYHAAWNSIRSDDLHQDVTTLASDAFLGRQAGERGGKLAADYLADQLKKLGVEPVLPDGSYFQSFSMPVRDAQPASCRNVLGVIRGSDPVLRDEYVVLCAHYDHVGLGEKGGSRGTVGQVHNGADDNASGSATLLELAEAFTLLPETPDRSILFAFWDAEEKGMLGSGHFVEHPPVPLRQITAVCNYDMVGLILQNRLTVFGSRTAPGLRELISRANTDVGLQFEFPWSVIRNSDHWCFFQKDVPVLLFHDARTGKDDLYHTDRDDTETIDFAKLQQVTQLALALTWELANTRDEFVFRESSKKENQSLHNAAMQALRKPISRLGVRLVFEPNTDSTEPTNADTSRDDTGRNALTENNTPGQIVLTAIIADSSASRANLRVGDRIHKIDGQILTSDVHFVEQVMTADAPIVLDLQREGQDGPLQLTVALDGPSMPLGMRIITSEAEPDTAIVTYVLPDSIAARHEIRPEDRIYRINGHRFQNVGELRQMLRQMHGEITIELERDGCIRTITIKPNELAA